MAPGNKGRKVNDEIWDSHFQSLKEFYQVYGTCPTKVDKKGKIARWVYKQRTRGKNMQLTARRIDLLNSIDFDWGVPRSAIAPIVPTSSSFRGLDYSASSDDYLVAPQNNGRTNSDSAKSHTFSQFKVRIPTYYKGIPDESDPDLISSNDDAAHENQVTEVNEAKLDEAVTTGALITPTTDPMAPDLSETEQRVHDHRAFIASLEKYGSNAGSAAGSLTWHAMAADLKWSIEDVKVYAYSYFKALTDRSLQTGGLKNRDDENKPTGGASINKPSWTFDELVLLDSLMLKYCKRLIDMEQVHGDENSVGSSYLIRMASPWENIAASLPGKTAKDCYEMGTLRMGLTSKGVQFNPVNFRGSEYLQLTQQNDMSSDISTNFKQSNSANDCDSEKLHVSQQNNLPTNIITNNFKQDKSQHSQSTQQEVQPSETLPLQESDEIDLTEGADADRLQHANDCGTKSMQGGKEALGPGISSTVEHSDSANNVQHLPPQESDPDFSNTSGSRHLQSTQHEMQELHVQGIATIDLTDGADDDLQVEQQEINPDLSNTADHNDSSNYYTMPQQATRQEHQQTKVSTRHSAEIEIDLTGEDDTDTIESDQQMLLLLQHSSKCKAEDGKCSFFAQCLEAKHLWKHMPECKTTNCAVRNCIRSRNVLRHYLSCKSAECEICGSLKK